MPVLHLPREALVQRRLHLKMRSVVYSTRSRPYRRSCEILEKCRVLPQQEEVPEAEREEVLADVLDGGNRRVCM